MVLPGEPRAVPFIKNKNCKKRVDNTLSMKDNLQTNRQTVDWRLKSTVFSILEWLPAGDSIHYLLQRFITKSLVFDENALLKSYYDKVAAHITAFEQFGETPINESRCYEFGAGWDLLCPIGVSLCGMKEYVCVDIKKLSHVREITNTITFYKHNATRLNIKEPVFEGKLTGANFKTYLKKNFGITYNAPYDARDTRLPAQSIDYIISNVTLEDIPENSIIEIVRECWRILKTGGIASFSIDYSDHYAHTDTSISAYNYLQFSEKEWVKYSPSIHYQNRLRNSDYVRIFEEAGFTILQAFPHQGSEKDIRKFEKITIADCFKKYSREDLLIINNHFILKK